MLEPLSAFGLNLGVAAVYALARPRTAVSSDAEHVRNQAVAMVERVERSDALFGTKAAVVSALWSLKQSHAEVGWDGGHARPVEGDAIFKALAFVRSMPDGTAMPEVGVEPDGMVTLDWLPSRHRMLSVTFASDSERLAYAWIDGTDRGNAVERFDGVSVPKRLLQAIRSIMHPASYAAFWVA
jgi:hypothetical protein